MKKRIIATAVSLAAATSLLACSEKREFTPAMKEAQGNDVGYIGIATLAKRIDQQRAIKGDKSVLACDVSVNKNDESTMISHKYDTVVACINFSLSQAHYPKVSDVTVSAPDGRPVFLATCVYSDCALGAYK